MANRPVSSFQTLTQPEQVAIGRGSQLQVSPDYRRGISSQFPDEVRAGFGDSSPNNNHRRMISTQQGHREILKASIDQRREIRPPVIVGILPHQVTQRRTEDIDELLLRDSIKLEDSIPRDRGAGYMGSAIFKGGSPSKLTAPRQAQRGAQ